MREGLLLNKSNNNDNNNNGVVSQSHLPTAEAEKEIAAEALQKVELMKLASLDTLRLEAILLWQQTPAIAWPTRDASVAAGFYDVLQLHRTAPQGYLVLFYFVIFSHGNCVEPQVATTCIFLDSGGPKSMLTCTGISRHLLIAAVYRELILYWTA